MGKIKPHPSLEDLKRHERWAELKPIARAGYDNARAGEYCNPYPSGTLRWHAFEIGHDTGVEQNEADEKLSSTNQPT